MPVPTTIADLSPSAGSNSPAGSDPIGHDLDDILRALSAFIRQYQAIGADMASAATVNVANTQAEHIRITGTTTITSLGTGYAGCYRELRFAGALQLTHSANLQLPEGQNFMTSAGDILLFRCLSPGVWACVGAPSGTDLAPLWSAINAKLSPNSEVGASATVNSQLVGYRNIPSTQQHSNYTFVVGDRGTGRHKTNTSSVVYTVPNSVFSAGDCLTVGNFAASADVTIAQGSGVTLRLAGSSTTGNRTVKPWGHAFIYFVSPSVALVSGSGVT